ncbi:PQQ-dependent sugar dehydrogenase [Salsuginibacillus kocurii]|uniref:PQQ-dependent sugar dehydrogenase n=1 Tax=Salsuginibacillus kocurii TaxID=427078 RepID=UPI000368253C|nr:PQQ-dependent sugar dehydrogenase [Salsuginibacillus kocurii]
MKYKKRVNKCLSIGAVMTFLTACAANEQDEDMETSKAHIDEDREVSEDLDDPVDKHDSSPADEKSEQEPEVEVLASELDVPWTMEKSEESIYFTERAGRIGLVEDSDVSYYELSLEETVVEEGEGGLLGFVLHPEKEDSAFIYHTYEDNGELLNRIVEINKEEEQFVETEELLAEIPGASIHNGGRLALSPAGALFATTGDADVPEWAQDTDNLAGSILKLNLDEVGDETTNETDFMYSYGHRNPQGLAWNEAGELYSSEHGPVGHDEINRIDEGENYGWPVIQGDETEVGMQAPEHHSGEDTWAPSGAAFGEDNQFYMTGLRGEALYRYNIEDKELTVVFENEGRLRDVYIEGNELYLLTNNTDGRGSPLPEDDRILKISNYEEL